MDLKRMFEALTPEQRGKFGAVKDAEGLNVLLAEAGFKITDEQSAALREYLTNGRLPLSDEKLESAVGGGDLFGDDRIFCPKCGCRLVISPYPTFTVKCARCGFVDNSYENGNFAGPPCPKCGARIIIDPIDPYAIRCAQCDYESSLGRF